MRSTMTGALDSRGDRMGIRLLGHSRLSGRGDDFRSIPLGAVQVPPDGQPSSCSTTARPSAATPARRIDTAVAGPTGTTPARQLCKAQTCGAKHAHGQNVAYLQRFD